MCTIINLSKEFEVITKSLTRINKHKENYDPYKLVQLVLENIEYRIIFAFQ